MRALLILLALALAPPVSAQSGSTTGAFTGIVPFNPLAISSFEIADPYFLSASFTEQFGVPVPAPVGILVPRHDDLHVRALAVPDNGALMVFVFSQDARDERDRVFLEDLQITDATIPLLSDQENPARARIRASVALLEEQVFPQWAGRYENAEILTIETIALGNVPGAVQLIARYFDQEFGANMLLRAVILPHPNQEASYMAVATIDLDLVPVVDGNTLAASLSGRVLSNWRYQ